MAKVTKTKTPKNKDIEELQETLEALESSDNEEIGVEDIENPESIDDIVEEPIVPERTDPGWTEYVMSQLVEGVEVTKEGIPTCDGLRRIFTKLIGPIYSSICDIIKTPNLNDDTATVIHTIKYYDFVNECKCEISDAFDVNKTNTKYPFHNASVATAVTKAEARALRKGLGLVKILSDEEFSQGFDSKEELYNTDLDASEQMISQNLKRSIQMGLSRGSIDATKLMGLLNFTGKTDLSELTAEQAQIMLRQLNEYAQGSIVPKSIQKTELIEGEHV